MVVFCWVEEDAVDDIAVVVGYCGEADALRGVAPPGDGEGEVASLVWN